MKCSRMAIWVATICMLPAGLAMAQQQRQGNVRPTAFDYGSYYADGDTAPSPSDQAPVADAAAPAAGGASCGCAANSGGCNTGCNSCRSCRGIEWPCGCSLADLGEPCKLFDCCGLQCRGIEVNGWLNQSFVWNPYSPNDRFNGPMTWTDRSNDYQMNELWLGAGKKANNEGCGLDVGWRVDAMYGTNYRWNTAAGLETNWNGNQFYGVALPNAYFDVAYDDWTFRLGHFVSPVGFYTVGSPNNFFPIIPYTYQYGEPFTHTGALATYKASDELSIGGGVVHGWDNFDSTFNPNWAGIATLTYAVNERDTFAFVGLCGKEINQSATFSTRYLQTLVYTRKFSDDVSGTVQSDLGIQDNALANGDTAYWYGINTYLYWNQTCRMQWGLNLEWFRDDGGFRVGTLLPSVASPNARGWAQAPGGGVAGFDGSFYRIAFGPKYFFTPNLYTRAAFVADFYGGSRDAAGQLPFDDGTKSSQQLGVFDLVYTF